MAHTNQLAANSAVQVAYVCDVDEQRAARAAEAITKGSGQAPKIVKDMRQVFDDKEVKAVWIATPDHWHAPAAILAAGLPAGVPAALVPELLAKNLVAAGRANYGPVLVPVLAR